MLPALAAMFATQAVFNPWIYFTGGHWHALPEWHGWGQVYGERRGIRSLYKYAAAALGTTLLVYVPAGMRCSVCPVEGTSALRCTGAWQSICRSMCGDKQ
jgi:hypothetical protein